MVTYAAKATHTARQIDKGEGKGGEERKRERGPRKMLVCSTTWARKNPIQIAENCCETSSAAEATTTTGSTLTRAHQEGNG